jgi:small GTP-binding protein
MADDDKDEYESLLKLVIMGDSSVGKSNYICRFVDGKFNPVHVSTVGFDFKSRIFEMSNPKKKVKFQIWDTAGQEKYMSINKNLFQRVQGIILMYDISNLNSFKNLVKWMDGIKENSKDVPVILIGNKCDLEGERQVQTEEGENFASKYDIKFFEGSAKTGVNVDKSFEAIGDIILNNDKYKENLETSKSEYVISKSTSNKKKKKCC